MSLEPIEEAFELIQDGRLQDALVVLDGEIHEQPNDARLHALRALVLLDLERRDEAAEEARLATDLEPDGAFVAFVTGEVALAQGDVAGAIAAATRARALDPGDADFVLLEARARLRAGQWDEVERLTGAVLADEPSHEGAALLATIARDARHDGPMSAADWQQLAERFPLNPFARSARAWTLLHAGRARDARAEFEQALALDPSSEWAREGLVLALKARAPGYQLLLRWFMWLARLSPRTRTLLAIGGVLGYNALRRVSEQSPGLKPFLIPVLVAYVALVLASWLADPLLNLALLATADGRRLLGKDDRESALLVGGCLGLAACFGLLGVLTPWDQAYYGAIGFGLVTLTVVGAYQCAPGRQRRGMLAFAGLLGTLAVASTIAGGDLGGILVFLVVLGAVLGTWFTGPLARRSRARLPE